MDTVQNVVYIAFFFAALYAGSVHNYSRTNLVLMASVTTSCFTVQRHAEQKLDFGKLSILAPKKMV